MAMFQAAVATADPAHLCVPPQPARDRPGAARSSLGAGKAAAAMAQAVERAWPADQPLDRASSSRDTAMAWEALDADRSGRGRASGARRSRGRGRAPHPGHGQRAHEGRFVPVPGIGRRIVAARRCRRPGVLLADKQAVNRALLRSGAGIHDFNCVRKHLSAIKGGRLAQAAAPARVDVVDHLRRAGRRPVGDRQRPNRGRTRRPVRGRAGRARALSHRRSGIGARGT